MNAKFNTLDMIHAIRYIPHSELNHQQYSVLRAIIGRNNSKNKFYISIETLAHDERFTKKTVSKHINYLEQKGYISVVRQAHYTHGKSNEYSVNIEKIIPYHPTKSGVTATTDYKMSGVNDDPSRVYSTSKSGVTATHQEAFKKKERKKGTSRAPSEARTSPPLTKSGYVDLDKDPGYIAYCEELKKKAEQPEPTKH